MRLTEGCKGLEEQKRGEMQPFSGEMHRFYQKGLDTLT